MLPSFICARRFGVTAGMVVALVLGASGAAAAEPSALDRKNALLAFEQGRALMAKGQTEEACSRFDEAMKLHPRVGYALNLAECEEQRGRLLRAAECWTQATALAEQSRDNRLSVARERAAKLDARLPRLTVTLSVASPPDTGVTIQAGTGEPRAWTSLGMAQPLDPGSYRFLVRANGREDQSYEVTLAESDRKELSVAVGPPVGGTPVAPAPTPPPEEEGLLDLEWSDWRTSGVVVAATGLVSLGIGTALGIMALDRRDDAEPHCNDRNICDADGIELREEAFELAHGSTATLIGGGVLLAGGALLFLVPELFPAEVGADATSADEPPSEDPVLEGEPSARSRRRQRGLSVAVRPSIGGAFLLGQW